MQNILPKSLITLFTVLSILFVLLSYSGSASAIGIMDPEETDKSITYMRYLFGDSVDVIFDKPGPDSPNTLLGSLSTVLNLACLIFTMVAIGIITLIGLLNTNRDGIVLGKSYDSMWVFFRVVITIVLLMPMASGFSVIQLGVIWFAGQGVGVVNYGWNTVLDHMDKNGAIYPPYLHKHGEKLALNILESTACMEVINRSFGENLITRETEAKSGNVDLAEHLAGTPLRSLVRRYTGQGIGAAQYNPYEKTSNIKQLLYSPSLPVNACGSFVLELPENDSEIIFAGPRTQFITDVQQALADLEQSIYTISRGMVASNDFYFDKKSIINASNTYDLAISNAAERLTSKIMDNKNTETGWVKVLQQDGWLTAGQWYMSIMRLNQEIVDITSLNPSYTRPLDEMAKIDGYKASMNYVKGLVDTRFTQDKYGNLENVQVAFQMGGDESGRYKAILLDQINTGLQASGRYEDPLFALQFIGHTIITGYELTLAAIIATKALAEGTLAAVSADGFDITDALPIFSTLKDVGQRALAGAAGSTSSILKDLLSYMLALGVLIIPIGISLAFYLPTMPYILWMIAVAGWFILLIEAVIAAPLWAAAHTLPEGDGAINHHAKAGYMICLSLFMRPLFMLFGLIASMVLMVVMGRIILMTFIPMVASVSVGYQIGIISVLAFLVILTGLVISVAHRSFGLIHEIPDKVFRYISGMGETLGEAKAESEGRQIFAGALIKSENKLSQMSGSKGRDSSKVSKGSKNSNVTSGHKDKSFDQ